MHLCRFCFIGHIICVGDDQNEREAETKRLSVPQSAIVSSLLNGSCDKILACVY
jgi:hypothetical protein